ncbi:MAG: 4-hydroxy-3-methylbut-2-enyl diphosphate reductase [Candidatus Omnitrophica bacterium]|nr:4-hydroxy-3-methylbut-2-enyl diphosphate reductase [Candidatus Omnitrophota bacterium]
MKITLAKSAGFCLGVKRALSIAHDIAKTNDKVYMLGDIVHNEDVVRDIKAIGIKKAKKLTRCTKKTLLIRAHGIPLKIRERAQKLGYHIVDATCPMVEEIHKIAIAMESQGFPVIVIGDKKHDEVKGIVGQLRYKALVLEDTKDIPVKKLKSFSKAAVVVQSTQNTENVSEIIAVLKTLIKDIRFFNTICKPTRTRQDEIRKLAKANETIIIIGSKTSANTKRLYQISKSLNRRTYWVQSADGLKKSWFKGVKTVGVDSGASTPDSTTNSVINQIRSYP